MSMTKIFIECSQLWLNTVYFRYQPAAAQDRKTNSNYYPLYLHYKDLTIGDVIKMDSNGHQYWLITNDDKDCNINQVPKRYFIDPCDKNGKLLKAKSNSPILEEIFGSNHNSETPPRGTVLDDYYDGQRYFCIIAHNPQPPQSKKRIELEF